MRRIFVKNNTINTKIIITDANDEIIFAEEYKRINARLMDDDMIVDRKTIAELCGMTEEELRSKYDLMHNETQRVFGEWALMYAEFEEREEEPVDTEDRYNTVGWEVNMHRLDKVCDILDMDNPLEGKEDMLISEVPMNLLYKLIKLSNAISAKDAYETEHSDYYGMWAHDDLFFEVGVDINTLISRIDEEIRNKNEKL